MHNIKGDATLCRVELAVAIAHPIETVLARLRNGEITFSDILAEAVLLAIDELELAVESLRASRPLENLRLLTLGAGTGRLARSPPSAIKTCASDLIEAVTGFRPIGEAATLGRRRTQKFNPPIVGANQRRSALLPQPGRPVGKPLAAFQGKNFATFAPRDRNEPDQRKSCRPRTARGGRPYTCTISA